MLKHLTTAVLDFQSDGLRVEEGRVGQLGNGKRKDVVGFCDLVGCDLADFG